MNESAQRRSLHRAIPLCIIVGSLTLGACSDDASLGKNPTVTSEKGGSSGAASAQGGRSENQSGAGSGGTSSQPTGGILNTGGTDGMGGAVETAGAGDVGTAGDTGSGGSGGGDGVVLTAVYAPGSGVIRARWYNGTDATILLRGCSTVDGWYREGVEWKEYGAFAVCAMEGLAVEVAPGATYEDPAAGVPPTRGDNVWRLIGPYGTGCTSGVRFSEANCAELHEATSVNEVTP